MENQALEKYRCYFCGGALNFLFFSRDYVSAETFSIYQCPACGLAVTKPDLSPESLAEYYPDSYYGRRKALVGRFVNYSRWRKIKKIGQSFKSTDKLSLLDVGCGDGTFISLLAGKNWRVSGTEIASAESYKGLTSDFICRQELTDCDFAAASFNVITMWHSLEHFLNPLAYLAKAESLLRVRGIILLEVPNFDSWQALFFKNNWFHLDAPRHIFHYNKKNLEAMLGRIGFSVKKTSTISFFYSIFGLTQSGLNLFSRRKNFLFDMINGKIGWREIYQNSIDVAVTLTLVWPIGLLALVVFLFECFFDRGPILTVWAQKFS